MFCDVDISRSISELHCEAVCLLVWFQGQDNNPGAIVGIHCLVKGHLLSHTEPLKYSDLNRGRLVNNSAQERKIAGEKSNVVYLL